MTFEVWLVPVPQNGQQGNWLYNAERKIYTSKPGQSRDDVAEWVSERWCEDRAPDKRNYYSLEIREVPAPPEYDL